MEDYRLVGRIGEGAHGVVFKAQHVPTGRPVALKKVTLGQLDGGVPNTALREIKALQTIEEHDNIVTMLEFFPHGAGVIMAFEYMPSDLSELLRATLEPLPEAQVKSYMLMLLRGVAFLHSKHIMHRDLKPANLLISATGELKIADFGQARVLVAVDTAHTGNASAGRGSAIAEERLKHQTPPHSEGWQSDAQGREDHGLYSHRVATRWYRAPELLYGACTYDQGVDLWAVGCILAELINHSPLFPGDNDINQLFLVTKALGTPDVTSWPELATLPDYNKILFDPMPGLPMNQLVPEASPTVIDLLEQLIVYRSCSRIAADKAIMHSFFFEEPLPTHHSELPPPPPRLASQPRFFDQPCSLVHPSLLEW